MKIRFVGLLFVTLAGAAVACEVGSVDGASTSAPTATTTASPAPTESAPAEPVCRCHCDVTLPYDDGGTITTGGCAKPVPKGGTCDRNYDLPDTLNCAGTNGGACAGYWPPPGNVEYHPPAPPPNTPADGTLTGCGRIVVAKDRTAAVDVAAP